MEAVQNRAACRCTSRWHNTSSVTEMKKDLGWEPLHKRKQYARVALFYKVHYGLVNIPMPAYLTVSTRQHCTHSLHYSTPGTNKDCLKYSFFYGTVHAWNMAPAEVVHSTSLDAFWAVAVAESGNPDHSGTLSSLIRASRFCQLLARRASSFPGLDPWYSV